MNIKIGDIVYHQLSKLLFRCENKKHERWMNMNPFYEKTNLKEIDYSKFETSKPAGAEKQQNDEATK